METGFHKTNDTRNCVQDQRADSMNNQFTGNDLFAEQFCVPCIVCENNCVQSITSVVTTVIPGCCLGMKDERSLENGQKSSTFSMA